jgi:glycosyltransferase involved in cell wall biosynthesis
VNLSIIIPVFDEVENMAPLAQGVREALSGLDYEMILVDDGSTDGSTDKLIEMAEADPLHTKVIELRRNFGQTAAIAAGIDHAVGDIIVTLDADLQNDPSDIPMLIEKINEGYDVVSGWRVNRQDAFLRRKLPSMIANWLISRVTGVRLHDYGCTLKAYRKCTGSFLPLLAPWGRRLWKCQCGTILEERARLSMGWSAL